MKRTAKKLVLATAIGLTVAVAAPAHAQFIGFLSHGVAGVGSPLGIGLGGGYSETDLSGGPGFLANGNGEADGLGIGVGVLTNTLAVGAGIGGGGASSSSSITGNASGGQANNFSVGGGIGLGFTTLGLGIATLLP